LAHLPRLLAISQSWERPGRRHSGKFKAKFFTFPGKSAVIIFIYVKGIPSSSPNSFQLTRQFFFDDWFGTRDLRVKPIVPTLHVLVLGITFSLTRLLRPQQPFHV
jgi:hypothetical protein